MQLSYGQVHHLEGAERIVGTPEPASQLRKSCLYTVGTDESAAAFVCQALLHAEVQTQGGMLDSPDIIAVVVAMMRRFVDLLVARRINKPFRDATDRRLKDLFPSTFMLNASEVMSMRTVLLNLAGRQIGDSGLSTLALPCGIGALPKLTELWLQANQIGDAGLAALASACGSLPELRRLYLHGNQIGDAGLAALASACGSGALPKLGVLALDGNPIGDAGLASLASACGSGALPLLTTLYLHGNQIGDAGLAALASACGSGALPLLTNLDLERNQIGDAGLAALASACGSGALPKLGVLALARNPIGDAGLAALAEAVGSGGLPALRSVSVNVEHEQALLAACRPRVIVTNGILV